MLLFPWRLHPTPTPRYRRSKLVKRVFGEKICLLTHRARLDHAPTRTLYHQTSHRNAKGILKDQEMRLGAYGLAGGGIYFATSVQDTEHKALNKGVILACDVKLGKIKRITKLGGDYDLQTLVREGYDSVLIPRNGDELVVYHPEQVVTIRVVKDKPTDFHSHGYSQQKTQAAQQYTGGYVHTYITFMYRL